MMRERLEEFESIPRRKIAISLTASQSAVPHIVAVLMPGSVAKLWIFTCLGSDALTWLCRFHHTFDTFSIEASMD